jgi:hypothetical protein
VPRLVRGRIATPDKAEFVVVPGETEQDDAERYEQIEQGKPIGRLG